MTRTEAETWLNQHAQEGACRACNTRPEGCPAARSATRIEAGTR